MDRESSRKAKLGDRGKCDGCGYNEKSGTVKTTFQSGDQGSWQGTMSNSKEKHSGQESLGANESDKD
jgi:hypothetical protein